MEASGIQAVNMSCRITRGIDPGNQWRFGGATSILENITSFGYVCGGIESARYISHPTPQLSKMQKGQIARDSNMDYAQPAFPDQASHKTIEFASRLNLTLK